MKQTLKPFLYRIEVTNKSGKRVRHLAEVQADLDEEARRQIIHKTMQEGGHVHSIAVTDDRTRYPGDKSKRNYGRV